MSANPNWARWTFASLSKYFNDAVQASNIGVPIYVEGDERITDQLVNYFEFRLDGPNFEEMSKDWWRLDVVVNILAVRKEDVKDFHLIHQMCGIIVSAFINGIPAFKLGDGPDDNSTIIWGCYQLDKRRGDAITISHIGQPSPELRERQAAIEAYYTMILASDV